MSYSCLVVLADRLVLKACLPKQTVHSRVGRSPAISFSRIPNRANGVPSPLEASNENASSQTVHSTPKTLSACRTSYPDLWAGRLVCESWNQEQVRYKGDCDVPGESRNHLGKWFKAWEGGGFCINFLQVGWKDRWERSRATKGEKIRVTSASESNLCPPKTPTGGLHVASQGK